MTIADISIADRDQFFSDWGVLATLREVKQFADPASGQLDELATDTPITVVGGHQASAPSSATAADYQTETTTFLVRSSDLPAGVRWPRCRIAVDSTEFAVIDATASPIDGTILLNCKALS